MNQMTRIEAGTPWPEPVPARRRLLARLLPRRREPEPVRLGRYAGGGWWRRHRRLLMTALVGFAFFYGLVYAVFGRFFLVQLSLPLVVLASAVVWLLPDTGRAPTTLLRRLLFAFVLALLCWPDYLALSLPGLPWITAIRLIGFPMIAVLLICTSVSSRFRAEVSETLSAFPLIGKLVVAFAVIAFLSIFLSDRINASFNKFLIAQMSWTTVFFASVFVFSAAGTITLFVRLLWGVLAFHLIVGGWEARIGQVPWAGRVPSFLKIEDEAVLRILAGAARAGTGIHRVQSKFTTPLGLAEFLGFAAPFVLHLTINARSIVTRIAGVVTLSATFWLILKTDSRLGVIGFFGALLAYLFFWAAMKWKRDARSLFGPAITLAYPAFFVTFIAATFAIGRLHAIVWGSGAQQASNDSREVMYRTGIPMVIKNPIGHGIGEGAGTLGFYNPVGILTIDTYYLAVALEYGLAGFIVYYGMFLAAIWRGGKTAMVTRDREVGYLVPICITLINFVVSKSVFSQQENHALIFALLGMVVALLARQRRIDREERPALT